MINNENSGEILKMIEKPDFVIFENKAQGIRN